MSWSKSTDKILPKSSNIPCGFIFAAGDTVQDKVPLVSCLVSSAENLFIPAL